MTEINILVQNLTNDKHRLEGDLTMMHQQLDDAITARRNAEERAERLAAEVARLTDQLRQEHDAVTAAEATRKKLEISLREISIRLEEVESLGDGKKNVMKMQLRVSHAPVTCLPRCRILHLLYFMTNFGRLSLNPVSSVSYRPI